MTACRTACPPPVRSAAVRHRRGEAGFSLVEMLVTVLLVALVMIAVLALFDMTSRTARTQTHIAEMQQSLRVAQQTLVRMVRMAGRGGLPSRDAGSALPDGIAVEVANNVPVNTLIGGDADARVLEGTDVVTVRGVFESPIFQTNESSALAYASGAETGSLTVLSTTPSGAPQSLAALRDAIQAVNAAAGGTHPEALLMVGPLGEWAVVEMVPGGGFVETVPGGEVTQATVQFRVAGGDFSSEYGALSKNSPMTLKTVAFAGLLEEYQFYVREMREVAGDASSLLMPELVRARLYPNTGVPYQRDGASLTEVIADNVLDLQVALGINHDELDGLIEENFADGSSADDEWLFNDPGDDATQGKWNEETSTLYYLRINTLVRTDRADPYYEDVALATIEDKDYTVSPFDQYNAEWRRRFHRRQLRTVVDLRNL